MANSIFWDPANKGIKVIIGDPDPVKGQWTANVNINNTPVNPEIPNRVSSSYKGIPLVSSNGFNYSFWQVPAQGGKPTNSAIWNVPGPTAAGGTPVEFWIQPTYLYVNQEWNQYGPPAVNGNTFTFNDPAGGGSTSVTIEMINPGGGGLPM
jgi:hypothetical protein